jgi:polyhydroxybutyrate depolymerase
MAKLDILFINQYLSCMKNFTKIISITILTCVITYSNAQTIHATMFYDGLLRTYSYYIPPTYFPSKPAALVFNLHGYGSNGDQQEFYGDFRSIADTAGFLIVHPTGTIHTQTNQTYWNCGLIAGGSNVNDIGFIHAIIDTLTKSYNINPNRIYSTGMSNGGFMSYHLACNSNRFAAIASVTGSMSLITRLQCNNANALPVMEIHGLADSVVKYNGSLGIMSIPEVLDFWITKNGLNAADVQHSYIPDIIKTDGANAELFIYPGKNELQHYKIINGAHTWPGAIIPIGVTCMDFNASLVIWNFFNRFSNNNLLAVKEYKSQQLQITPNPVERYIYLPDEIIGKDCELTIVNLLGEQVLKLNSYESKRIDVSGIPQGFYMLLIRNKLKNFRASFIKSAGN